MDKLVIQGGKSLNGTIEVGGSKNCALPVLFATLLAPAKHSVQGVPRLQDMESTLRMLVHLGGSVQQSHKRAFGSDWIVDATNIEDRAEAPYDLVRKMRASVLCFGPLLARRGYARVSLPGGCAIGARPIDLHLMAFEKMGAVVSQAAGYVEAEIPKALGGRLQGAKIIFPMVSVGATENAVMAACLAKGETILENAAREPEIRELCVALRSMGAKIEGEGSSTITVQGVEKLGAMNFRIPPDRIEAATYLIGAQMTAGRVRLEGAHAGDLEFVLEKLEQSGAKITRGESFVECQGSKKIEPVDVLTAPFPGFATDVQAQWMALMTQAEGESSITETIFENRFMHVPELVRMGAKLTVNGSSVRTKGERGTLEGAPVMATDLRASACLVLAGLVAKGETQVKRIYHLDRGYESMEVKLRTLGADVERLTE